jgi:hypothetical protein
MDLPIDVSALRGPWMYCLPNNRDVNALWRAATVRDGRNAPARVHFQQTKRCVTGSQQARGLPPLPQALLLTSTGVSALWSPPAFNATST